MIFADGFFQRLDLLAQHQIYAAADLDDLIEEIDCRICS